MTRRIGVLLVAMFCACQGELLVAQTSLEGHDKPVADFAWDPAGKYAASIDVKGQVILWNLEESSALKLTSDPLNLDPSHHLQFSSDGKRLFVGSSWCVRIWDVDAKKSIAVMGKGGNSDPLMVSRNGATVLIAVTSKNSAYEWVAHRTADGSEIARITYTNWQTSLAMDAEGVMFALPDAQKDLTRLFDLRAGKEAGTIRGVAPWSNKSALVVTPGGEQLIGCDNAHTQITFWSTRDPAAPKLLFQAKMPYVVQGLLLSPEGKTLAIAESRKIHLLDVTSRKERNSVVAAEMWGSDFCDNGSRLMGSIGDGQYVVADVSTGNVVTTISASGMGGLIRLSPLGDKYAVADGGKIELRSLASGKGESTWKEIASLAPPNVKEPYRSQLRFSPDGGWLLQTTEEANRLIRIAAPNENQLIIGKSYTGEPHAINSRSVLFSQDSKRLFFGSVGSGFLRSSRSNPLTQQGHDSGKYVHMSLDLSTKKLSAPIPTPITYENIWASADGSHVAATMMSGR